MQTRSAITIIDDKNDINALIYYKYNKFTIIYSKPSTLVMLSISSFNRLIVPSRILPKTLDFIKIIIILFGIKVYCYQKLSKNMDYEVVAIQCCNLLNECVRHWHSRTRWIVVSILMQTRDLFNECIRHVVRTLLILTC